MKERAKSEKSPRPEDHEPWAGRTRISVDTNLDFSSEEFARPFLEDLFALDNGRLAPEFFNAAEPVNRSIEKEGVDAAVKLWWQASQSMCGIYLRRRHAPKMLLTVESGPRERLKYHRFPFWCSFSLLSAKFEREAQILIRFLVKHFAPAFGRANLNSDLKRKHHFAIRQSDGVLERSEGVAPDTQVPGIYWLTFLGPWAIEMIGRDRIETLPVGEVERMGEGYLIKAYPHINQAGTPEALAAEESIKDHLGRQHFFDRSQVDIEKLKNPPHVEKAIREAAERMMAEGKKSTTLEI